MRFENDKLIIESSRPGLLIGKRGGRIESLQKFLGREIHIEETVETIEDYILVVDYANEFYDLEDDFLTAGLEKLSDSEFMDEIDNMEIGNLDDYYG